MSIVLYEVAPASPDAPVSVLLNDLDQDGNPLWITGVSKVTNGTATIDPVKDQILFTPQPGFYGFATLEYTISDGAATDAAEVVVKVNDWPTATDDAFQIRTNSVDNKLMILNNDVERNQDDIVTVLAFDPPSKGTAFIDPTGTYISYTPFPGATGTDRSTTSPATAS